MPAAPVGETAAIRPARKPKEESNHWPHQPHQPLAPPDVPVVLEPELEPESLATLAPPTTALAAAPPTRSATTRPAIGLPRPVTRSYPTPARYLRLLPLVMSRKSSF